LNVERNGFPVAVYNRTPEKTDAFMHERAEGKNVKAAYSIEDFVNSWNVPAKF
jgi:6-phosphogluconate dehydrogenase